MTENSVAIKSSNALLKIAEEDQQTLSSLFVPGKRPNGSYTMMLIDSIVKVHHAVQAKRKEMSEKDILEIRTREINSLYTSANILDLTIEHFDQIDLSSIKSRPAEVFRKTNCARDAVECELQRLEHGYRPHQNSTLFIDFFSDSASFHQDQLAEFLIIPEQHFPCSSLKEHARILNGIHRTDQFSFVKIEDPGEAFTFGKRHEQSLRRSRRIANLLCATVEALTTALDPQEIQSTNTLMQHFKLTTDSRLDSLVKWLDEMI